MSESVKLSVTVRSALERKYRKSDLAQIDRALKAWIAADKARGIRTVHVALDSAAEMGKHGCAAISGTVTAVRAKKAVDALARALSPDYIVLVGGHDVLPYFNVPNPDFARDDEPVERDIPTDNPYATSRAFVASARKSYLVPDRVVGRLPDLPADAGKGDPATLLACLRTATTWSPKARSYYAEAYATCTATWKQAGQATMQFLGLPPADLMISPPTVDGTATARARLRRPLHFTKCHGANLDAHYFGETLTKPADYPEVLFSTTVRAQTKPGTLAAAMCCYGANVYSPSAPLAAPVGALPMAIAYLQAGALGFAGATRIAYVGNIQMMCADWIVGSFLKKSLDGASLGRALLEAKQDYLQYLVNQGINPDTADEKTMIEFVLLGDPSLHAVVAALPPGAAASPVLRSERRAARMLVAAHMQKALPRRLPADTPTSKEAERVFKAAASLLPKGAVKAMDPGRATASRLIPATYRASAPRSAGLMTPAAAERVGGEIVEYTWATRKQIKAGFAKVQVLKVQADLQGTVLRSRTLFSA